MTPPRDPIATRPSDSVTAPPGGTCIDGTSEPEIPYSHDSLGPGTSDHQNAHATGERGSGGSSPIVTSADGSTNKEESELEIVFPLIPAAVGVAILKYRLYEIDRLISRTLAYAIVTGLLVGVYAGLVVPTTQVFLLHTPVAVAASTLVAAALFSPLRRRVQQVVDRRFNRVRYDADQTVAAFASRLQDAVDLGTVRADLLAAVNSAVEVWHHGPECPDLRACLTTQ